MSTPKGPMADDTLGPELKKSFFVLIWSPRAPTCWRAPRCQASINSARNADQNLDADPQPVPPPTVNHPV